MSKLPGHERAVLEQVMACTIAGGPQRVREGLRSLIEQTGADELMIDCRIHDPLARQRSHALAASALASLA
jgi:alkanesulfonate monooxygenase SsuD/methylene tetrahydromethanopterin reductase-like flavin-dependent oxidoreductase (luciferase family)